MKTRLPGCFALLALVLHAHAADVVNNLANDTGAQIPLSDPGSSAAQAFTTGADARTLDRIVVRLRASGAFSTNTARVRLWTGAGAVPETLVEDLGTAVNIPVGTDADMTVLSAARPVLAANTTYWVSVTNVDGDFDWRNTSNAASTGTGTLVQARATSTTGNVGSWTAFGSAANFQFMRVETRSALAVTTDADSGAGSLRQAVLDAASLGGPDFILFDPSLSGKTITLTGGEIVLNTNVTIDATTLPRGVTISGNNASRIFLVTGGATVGLHGLTLTGGNVGAGNGGAIFNASSTLTVTRCTLTGNSASSGGAIGSNTADITGPITSSTTLLHCTFSGNSASLEGGAVINFSGRTTLTHCTVTANTAPANKGSGVASVGDQFPETVVRSSVISGNTNSSVDLVLRFGTNSFTSLGGNIIGSGNATGDFNQPGDIINNAPNLAPLGDYGGPTRTMPPLSTSQARDGVLGFPGATDQRGLAIGDYVYENDFAAGLKGASVRTFGGNAGTGTLNAGSFRFTPEATGQGATVVLPAPTNPVTSFAASFDIFFTAPQGPAFFGPADGFSFSFGPAPAGTVNEFGINPGHVVSFQTFDVGVANGGDGDGEIRYRRDGVDIATSAVAINRTGDANQWQRITVTLDATGRLRVTYKGQLALDVATGYTYADGDTFTLASRTGAAVSENRMDNLGIVTNPVGGRPDIGAVEGGLVIPGFAPVVTSTLDTFDGLDVNGVSLREAAELAPAGAGITFAPALSGQTITLGGSEISLNRAVTIDATALSGGITISGNNASQIFRVDGSGGSPSVSLRGLTLTGGKSSFGGGGAIENNGATLALERCTLHGNTADLDGGAISSGAPGASLVLAHCTLTGNTAGKLGGAISAVGSFSLRHCTVTGNTAALLGGGVNFEADGTFTLENSIVAGNTATDDATSGDIFLADSANLTRVGANLVQNFANIGTGTVGGPAANPAAPLLAPLGNYGGPTPTRPPLFDSPALDAAVGSTDLTDQRGLPRAADADGDGTAVADIGAVELQVRLVTTAADENDGIGVGAGTSLREAVADASGASDIIRFDPALSGATLTLGGQIVVSRSVSVDASNLATGPTIDGGAATRLFLVNSGVTCTFTALALANGKAANTGSPLFASGSGIYNSGMLTVNRCTFTGNAAPSFAGGGIYNNNGASLTVNQSTFTANTAAQGGGIYSDGTLTVNQSTLTENSAPGGNGGGLYNINNLRTLTLRNSIVAGNSSLGGGADIVSFGTLTREGANIVQDFLNSGTESGPAAIDAPPQLAPLASNGGPTQTMRLLPGSPARNAAVGSTATSDQRGFPKLGTADIGAYETQIGAIANAVIDEDAATGTLGFSVGQVGTLSVASGNPAVVPDATIVLGGSGAARTVSATPAPDANGAATITLTDSLTGETQSFLLTVTAVNDPPRFTAGPKQFVFVDSGARTVNGWATGIAAGPANESAQSFGFNVGNDNNALFAVQPAIAADGTLTFTPAAGATGRATVTVSLSDDGAPVETSAAQVFTIAVRLLNPRSTVLHASGSDAPGRGTNGLPADAKLASFRPPATSDAGDVAFLAKWTSATGPLKRGTGLFLNDKCLAIVGGDASAVGGTGAKWARFTDPVVDAGHAVCIAKLSDRTSAVVGNLTGASLAKIARTGEEAPLVAGPLPGTGPKFASFKAVEIVGDKLAYLATLAVGSGTPKVTAATDTGIWFHDPTTALVALREGQSDPGSTIKSLAAFVPGNGSPGCGRGTFIVPTDGRDPQVAARVVFTDKTNALIAQEIGRNQFGHISDSGEQGSGTLTNETFAGYSVPARNRTGTTVFLGKLTPGPTVTAANASGIFGFPDVNQLFTTLARVGDPAAAAGTGATFKLLKDPVLNEDGDVAFPATVKGVRGAGGQTLWWKPSGQPLALLAQGGAPATELTSSKWKAFKSLAIAADRGPIFTATVAPRGSGVWANDFTGALRLLFNTGAPVTAGGKTVKSFTLLKASAGSTGVTRSFNDAGQVVWLATFTDKTTAIVTTEVP